MFERSEFRRPRHSGAARASKISAAPLGLLVLLGLAKRTETNLPKRKRIFQKEMDRSCLAGDPRNRDVGRDGKGRCPGVRGAAFAVSVRSVLFAGDDSLGGAHAGAGAAVDAGVGVNLVDFAF